MRYQSAREMRAELQRLKRDTGTGRVPVASSRPGAVAQDSGSQPVVRQPVAASGSSPAVASSPSSGSVKVTEAPVAGSKKIWKILLPAAVIVVVALIAGGLYFRSRPTKPLTEKDTIVLADFTNTTGDPVFDDALKQALAVDLEQSPFLNVLSDRRMGETLRLMGRHPNEHVTREVA